jgi:hypothetical protein
VVQVENLNKLVDPEVAEDQLNQEVELDQEHLDKETLEEEETILDHLIQTLEVAEEELLSQVKVCLQVDLCKLEMAVTEQIGNH